MSVKSPSQHRQGGYVGICQRTRQICLQLTRQSLDQNLDALALRASTLQTRLIAALDTLDAQQLAHDAEVARLSRRISKMEKRMQHLQAETAQSEEERDDMRGAVEMLIQKVQRAHNNLGQLRQAQIVATELLEMPLAGVQHEICGAQDFSLPLITSLQAQLSQERILRQQERERAENQILLLRAQVARREVELETNVLKFDGNQPLIGQLPPEQYLAISEDPTEDVLVIARQRTADLETEVERLKEKLLVASHPPLLPVRAPFREGMETDVTLLPRPCAVEQTNVSDFKNISLLEEECIRLTDVEKRKSQLLRDGIQREQQFQAVIAQREKEIARLRAINNAFSPNREGPLRSFSPDPLHLLDCDRLRDIELELHDVRQEAEVKHQEWLIASAELHRIQMLVADG